MKLEHVREIREERGLKQEEVARVLQVAQNTYSQYETGKIAYTDAVLICLAEFYGTSVDYLLGLTNEKKPYPRIKK